jgi:hypothetical protein
MDYGVNIFRTVTATDYCAKLPQPVTGKSTKIVNMTSQVLMVYPSNIGGKINNLAVDTPVSIPPDGVPYEFICIENPLPGAWTVSLPAIGQIEFLEIEVNHTQGVASGGVGLNTANVSLGGGGGAGLDGAGNIVFTGNWTTELTPRVLKKFKCYSNMLITDISGGYAARAEVYVMQAHKIAVNSVVHGQIATSLFQDGNWAFNFQTVATGALSSPAEIGDTGTLYDILTVAPAGESNNLGLGGAFSSGYYTLGFSIAAASPTKVYKFKIFLEYV